MYFGWVRSRHLNSSLVSPTSRTCTRRFQYAGCLLCRRRGEQDWSDARLQHANPCPCSCKRNPINTRLQLVLHLTAIKNPFNFFFAAPTSNILIPSPPSCAIPPAPNTPARHHHWSSCSNTLPIRVTGDRPTGNLSAHGGKPTTASGLTALEGPLTMWTNGLSSANQQVGVPVGDLEYDLSIPLDYSDRRAVDGKDGRWPETVQSEAMVQGGHPVCHPRVRLSTLAGVIDLGEVVR